MNGNKGVKLLSIRSEFSQDGAIVLKRAINESDFSQIDGLLTKHWRKFSIDDPYSENAAQFAKENPHVVTSIYDEVINSKECIQIARVSTLKRAIHSLIGADAKIYSKVPLRIDAPLQTKELAVWHQDDFYVKGAK